MQSIASENNVSDTAFVVVGSAPYAIRWFTPTAEIDLCGHATLATAFILHQQRLATSDAIDFTSASGPLRVSRESDRLALDFPSRPPSMAAELTQRAAAALGAAPTEVHASHLTMAVFRTEKELAALTPDMEKVRGLPGFGLLATAAGTDADFVSRFFVPKYGVAEDPVTGSSHCTLIPYWSARLRKKKLFARQLSKRGGELWCEDRGERVSIAGHCSLYLHGEIDV
jgi:PhzF family phenazine biosynthesis protein